MLLKNIVIWVTKETQKLEFSQKAHVSRFTAIHHLNAEIESFKMVCNTSLGLFLAKTKESPICEDHMSGKLGRLLFSFSCCVVLYVCIFTGPLSVIVSFFQSC